MSYKHIAVAVSNTPEDYTLVTRALLVAGQRQLRLTLIHVDDELAELYSGVYGADAAQIISELGKQSDGASAATCKKYRMAWAAAKGGSGRVARYAT